MSDLPAKQSAFAKMFNNIVNAGLRNRVTRRIMANIAPKTFGYNLINHVLNNDNSDLRETMELLSSMNAKAVKANIRTILINVKGKINSGENYYDNSHNDQLVNMILDAVPPEVSEFVCFEMLEMNYDDLIDYSVSDETCKRISDSIDCSKKNSAEIEKMFNVNILNRNSATRKIAYNLFENLTLEQRKEHFSKIIQIIPGADYFYSEKTFTEIFSEFFKEDRLEQYKKILDIYKDENKIFTRSLKSLSKCFVMLSEEERVSILEETYEQIRDSNNDDLKGTYLLEIIGNVPAKEQEKYYKEVLNHYVKGVYQLNEYVSNLDKSLQEHIVFDVINKIREEAQSSNFYFQFDTEVSKIINSFEPEVINNAFITILNGNVDDPNINFILNLLPKYGIMERIEKVAQNQQIINYNQLIALQQKGYNINELAVLFTGYECNRILHEYINNPEKKSYVDVLKEVAEISFVKEYEPIVDKKLDIYIQLFSNVKPEEREDFFYETLDAMSKEKYASSYLKLLERKSVELYRVLDKESQVTQFTKLINASSYIDYKEAIKTLFKQLDNDTQVDIFKYCTLPDSENLKYAVEILNACSIKELNTIFKGKVTLDEETISKLITEQDNIAIKTLLFDKDVDREKLLDLSAYEQLQTEAINIDSIVQNLYLNTQGKNKQEFNQLLSDTYNLFTYNNVPEFMKNFRMFQLGKFYDKENNNIISFQDKSNEERDTLILEDLFKISLDSNNVSLRDFSNIIIEGKRLTTVLQVNPEEKIKTLSAEELALLNQYRDTLFDMHNITKEIRNTDRPKIEKTDDVIKDLRTLISIYSDNKEHNSNSKNIVFNPNKIMDELFKGFITTTIRPKAMLEYMDRRKEESDIRHLEIEKMLREGTMHLQAGDFVKGIPNFEDYIPSMLRDGIKGGEFNQEHSHSDLTPLDADFGYVSKGNIKKENSTDYDVISTTVSASYGENYIVLKQYADRLQDRSRESFDQGTFSGSPDYYEFGLEEDATGNSRYIRTGIPITDVDYIVSKDWNPKNGYEMAMAGIYIPVINQKGEIVFSSEDYNKIREEMRGLSHYGAEDLQVSEDARNMETLYSIYRSVSSKETEEIEEEIETVRELVEGKPDDVTEKKKKATTEFIKSFFKSQGIKVTDDLSQDLSSKSVELIDTGSTGRGTNVPGDGDFDFMLRHNLPSDVLEKLSEKIKELALSNFIVVGDGFRAKDVTLPTGEIVDIDITTAKKSLALSYSSDMCVRDRLNNIKENNPESYNYVQANIIMAKKILKAKGIYKKFGSDGATEHGGFGGIGVENWILQNGGSFKQAIDSFLEVANEVDSYNEFKKKYPIFDFGFNHREGKVRHDRFSAFFANDESHPEIGFEYVKETLTEIQKSLELEKEKQEMQTPLLRSISPEGFAEAGSKRSILRNRFSYSRVRGMMSKYMSVKEESDVQFEEFESDLEVV